MKIKSIFTVVTLTTLLAGTASAASDYFTGYFFNSTNAGQLTQVNYVLGLSGETGTLNVNVNPGTSYKIDDTTGQIVYSSDYRAQELIVTSVVIGGKIYDFGSASSCQIISHLGDPTTGADILKFESNGAGGVACFPGADLH